MTADPLEFNRGWAYENNRGQRDIRTTSHTRIGTMINALFWYSTITVKAGWTPEEIEAEFEYMLKYTGGKMIAVTLTIRDTELDKEVERG